MKKCLFLSLFILLLTACKKETGVKGPDGPQGNQGEAGAAGDTGTVAGSVALYNEYAYPETTGNAGVVVSLTSGSLTLKDTTDATGQYHFSGLQTGTYNLVYNKTGYGTMKVYGLSHIAGGPLPTGVIPVDLVQMPSKTAPTGLTGQFNYSYYLFTITLNTSSADYEQYSGNALFCIGKNDQVSPTDNIKSYSNVLTPDGNGNYFFTVSVDDLSPFFNTGDTMYIKVYTMNRYLHFNSASGDYTDPGESVYYIDPASGAPVYPNLSAPVLLTLVY